MFEQAEAHFGSAPQAVIANAGINVPGAPVASFSPENFRLLMDVNVIGAFNVLAEAARRVRDGGADCRHHHLAGAARRSGHRPLQRDQGSGGKPRAFDGEGALRPPRPRQRGGAGPVDTDLFNAGKTEEAKQRMAAFSPFNRIGRPEEVAEVVRFLASDQASWVQGQIVQPNGGMV